MIQRDGKFDIISKGVIEMTNAQIAVREDIYKRFMNLSDYEATQVLEFINTLMDDDEEPLSEDELAQIEASNADIEAGRVYPWDEVKRRLADLP